MRLRDIPGPMARRRALAAAGVLVLALAGCAAPEKVVEEDTTDYVWPQPPEQPRVRWLKNYAFRADVEEEEGVNMVDFLLGKAKSAGESLKKPYAVHADKDGRIFVADTGWGKVVVFDPANKKFAFWGQTGNGALSKPVGVTSDSQGRVYVTDALQKRVVVFDKDGKFYSAMGRKGELSGPAGIAVDENLGRAYVVDTKAHHIAVFDLAQGVLVSTLGERGSEPGQFNFPTNLALGNDGNLYVMDTLNFRVQILASDGRFLKAFGQLGDNLGMFARPKGIAIDSDGNVYVVDAAFNNFQIFNTEGQLLLFVGGPGYKAGGFRLPAGIYIDDQDRIYVADQYNYRIQVFQYLGDDGVAGAAAEAAAGAVPQPATAPQ